VKFLRIENELGRGPYQDYRISQALPDRGRRQPSPFYEAALKKWRDMETTVRWQFSFGFLDEAQLRAWFDPEDLELLQECGYTIHEVEGELLCASKKQAIFKRHST